MPDILKTMSLTESQMLELGTKSPDFNLTDVISGKSYKLSDFDDNKALLVMFICSHCPYVMHIEEKLTEVANSYLDKEVGVVAISSNDPDYESEDGPVGLKKQANKLGFNFPYLFDETQEVSKKYSAACTPDLFVFDEDQKLTYRGQFDDSRPGNGKPVTGEDLKETIDATLSGKPVDTDQKPSSGCNIKWKPGNEPKYY